MRAIPEKSGKFRKSVETRPRRGPTRPDRNSTLRPPNGGDPATNRTGITSPTSPWCSPVKEIAGKRDLDRHPIRVKTRSSPAPIPATSGRSTTWVLLLSSPATHPWWLIITAWPEEEDSKLGIIRPPSALEAISGQSIRHLTSR